MGSSKIESMAVGSLLGVLCPASLFLSGWWGAALLSFWAPADVISEKAIIAAAIAGLFLGVLLDVLFLKQWARNIWHFKAAPLICAYLFYSIVVLGLCMGVPVLNLGLGAVAGGFVGRKLRRCQANQAQVRKGANRVGLFTAMVIFAVSCLSGLMAMVSPSTPTDLARICHLQAPINWLIIAALIVAGGSALVVLQYWLAAKAAMLAYRMGGTLECFHC